MPVDPVAFKSALSRWVSGVSVVTTVDDGMLYGLTVSSFSSLSLDPPLVLVCINNANRLVQMVEGGQRFAVNILGTGQVAASNYFARPGRLPTTDFTEIDGDWMSGVPVVAGSLAWIVCHLHTTFVEGDHTILVGRVEEARVHEGEPLLYFDRSYRGVGPGLG